MWAKESPCSARRGTAGARGRYRPFSKSFPDCSGSDHPASGLESRGHARSPAFQRHSTANRAELRDNGPPAGAVFYLNAFAAAITKAVTNGRPEQNRTTSMANFVIARPHSL
jgi:hypothetical protein